MRDSRTAVAACLLPITRETIVGPLLCQLRDDDWAVLSDVDVYRGGSARIRNRLLDAALGSKPDIVRFADDDDLIYPHRTEAMEALADADVAYFDFDLAEPGINPMRFTFSDDPWVAASWSPGPWAWVARGTALEQFRHKDLFDPVLPCLQGGFAFLKLLQAGLRVVHAPHLAYRWRRSHFPPNVNDHPEAAGLHVLLKQQIQASRPGLVSKES